MWTRCLCLYYLFSLDISPKKTHHRALYPPPGPPAENLKSPKKAAARTPRDRLIACRALLLRKQEHRMSDRRAGGTELMSARVFTDALLTTLLAYPALEVPMCPKPDPQFSLV